MDFDKYKNTLPYQSRYENQDAYYAYMAEESRLQDQFKEDLFDDLSISDNPKRHKLYSKAWDRGHYAGFLEVYSVACDLVDLIED